jgi:hypothetical protein
VIYKTKPVDLVPGISGAKIFHSVDRYGLTCHIQGDIVLTKSGAKKWEIFPHPACILPFENDEKYIE